MASSLPEHVLYHDVQTAIMRCMSCEPTRKADYALSEDASLLAEVLGVLIWRKAHAVPTDSLTPQQREALLRWRS